MLVGVAFLPPSFSPSGTQAFYIIKRQNCLNICNTLYLLHNLDIMNFFQEQKVVLWKDLVYCVDHQKFGISPNEDYRSERPYIPGCLSLLQHSGKDLVQRLCMSLYCILHVMTFQCLSTWSFICSCIGRFSKQVTQIYFPLMFC